MSESTNYKTFSMKPEVVVKLRQIAEKEQRSMSSQLAYMVNRYNDDRQGRN